MDRRIVNVLEEACQEIALQAHKDNEQISLLVPFFDLVQEAAFHRIDDAWIKRARVAVNRYHRYAMKNARRLGG